MFLFSIFFLFLCKLDYTVSFYCLWVVSAHFNNSRLADNILLLLLNKASYVYITFLQKFYYTIIIIIMIITIVIFVCTMFSQFCFCVFYVVIVFSFSIFIYMDLGELSVSLYFSFFLWLLLEYLGWVEPHTVVTQRLYCTCIECLYVT